MEYSKASILLDLLCLLATLEDEDREVRYGIQELNTIIERMQQDVDQERE